MLAQAIHQGGAAPKAVHCRQLRAIPALLESELLSRQGAFTDASSVRGLFQAADGGTCCSRLATCRRRCRSLLRVLQERGAPAGLQPVDSG
jgi:DNA-binding NtrC family response regulator